MRKILSITSLVVAALVAAAASAQPEPEDGLRIKPIERFSGRLKAGQERTALAQDLEITSRDWILENFQKIERFPEQGFLIVQLKAGELTTTIDGVLQKRRTDEIWTVPARSMMSIEIGRDAVILHVVAIQRVQPAGGTSPTAPR